MHFYSGLFEPGISSNTWQNILKIHLLLRLPGAEDLCGAIKKAYQASAEFLGLQCFEGNLGNLKIKNVFVFLKISCDLLSQQ